jgi:hypothetical protein
MKLGRAKVVCYCATLDKALYPVPYAVGGFSISHLGGRIEFGRHSASHGQWGDISSEAVFYGLMTALVFHSQICGGVHRA